MLFSLSRAAAAGALFFLLSSCSASDQYPMSSEPASPQDPVHGLRADLLYLPAGTF